MGPTAPGDENAPTRRRGLEPVIRALSPRSLSRTSNALTAGAGAGTRFSAPTVILSAHHICPAPLSGLARKSTSRLG